MVFQSSLWPIPDLKFSTKKRFFHNDRKKQRSRHVWPLCSRYWAFPHQLDITQRWPNILDWVSIKYLPALGVSVCFVFLSSSLSLVHCSVPLCSDFWKYLSTFPARLPRPFTLAPYLSWHICSHFSHQPPSSSPASPCACLHFWLQLIYICGKKY